MVACLSIFQRRSIRLSQGHVDAANRCCTEEFSTSRMQRIFFPNWVLKRQHKGRRRHKLAMRVREVGRRHIHRTGRRVTPVLTQTQGALTAAVFRPASFSTKASSATAAVHACSCLCGGPACLDRTKSLQQPVHDHRHPTTYHPIHLATSILVDAVTNRSVRALAGSYIA